MSRVWPGPAAAVLFVVALACSVAALVLGYWLYGCVTMRYDVTRDGLSLTWAASRTTIPMGDITHLMQGRPYDAPLRGLRWPGLEVGRTSLTTDDGTRHDLLVLATAPPERQLIVLTPGVAYALSPADRTAFVEEFKRRLRMGSIQQTVHGTRHPVVDRLGLRSDPLAARLLALGLAANVLAFAWLIWHYPVLPDQVALWHRFDPSLGISVAAGLQPSALAWQLPATAMVALAVNALLAAAVQRRARLGAQLLALGATLVQIIMVVTLTRISP
jgi:hypothetical protein